MRIFLFIALSLLLFSCKKDNFKGDYHELVGVWKWTYSKVYWINNGNFISVIDTLYPDDYGYNYEVEFHANGKISFYQNDKLIECWKKNCVSMFTSSFTRFQINHNCNASNMDLICELYPSDTLILNCRPLNASYSTSYNYYPRANYFVREK